MIADLKPYPEIKDSGVPWLGKVPEHWAVRRLGAVVRERGETNDDNHVTDVLSVMRERGVIPYAEKGNVGNKKSEDITRYKIVCPNDIVVNCMNVIIGSVGLSKYTGCLSPVYYVLTRRSEDDNPRYLNAYFQTKPFQLSLVRIGNGILSHRMRIPMELLKCELFPIPPPSEQSAIVRFLDHADRRIRRYIRAKQKLIKLLEEQKQAIIHRAVTRGLDPNVRLKPSGVEWLGDVPAHWEVRPAKFYYREVDERSSTGNEELLSVSHITGVTPRSQKNITMFMAVSNVGYKICQPGDLAINTMWAWMAALGIARESGIVSPAYGVYRPQRGTNLLGEYADLLLRTKPYVNEYICRSTGIRSSRLRLYPEQFLKIKLICPPIKEQYAILSWVGDEIKSTKITIESAKREIDLLREYRTRLIADVVTGKVDVREAAARLPDEVEEPEPIEEEDGEADDEEEETADDSEAVSEEAEA